MSTVKTRKRENTENRKKSVVMQGFFVWAAIKISNGNFK
jgi:hypothetical protein